MTRHIVVIGAGIVGVACALELARDGHRVTVVDPDEPGGPQAASYGNGAWISPASVVPMSTPGLWRRVPGFLMDPTGPFTIRPRALPGLLPWLVRFARAGATLPRVEATARHLRSLLEDAPDRHAALAAEAGLADLIRRDGLLYVYPDRAAFTADALVWHLRRENGIVWTEIEGAALRAREPDLSPRYTFAALVPAGAHCRDTGGYVAALLRHAETLGVRHLPARATGFVREGGRLSAVETDAGPVLCDGAVVAAGIASGKLARAAGDRVSLAGERGYHVLVESPGPGPRIPVMPSDGRMANTPMAVGLRASGQVELARPDAAPDWNRAAILLAHLKTAFPGLPQNLTLSDVGLWMGSRPSTPDGVPVIGPSRRDPRIVYAFGHGHVGFAAGPISGRAVADLFAGRRPVLPLHPFRASRFRPGG